MSKPVQIIDLFSGPGGLGEGFSSCMQADGSRAYEISVSIEKDSAAHKTLRLRAFLRQFSEFPPEYYSWISGKHDCPDWKKLYPREWNAAENEAVCAELGKAETAALLSERISETKRTAGDRTLLIGGPPCQAYSLAGRSRNAGIRDYRPKDDERHFLYREYCRVLNELSPAVFVMENVKGMLSSSVEGLAIFEQVMSDLQHAGPGYSLLSLSANIHPCLIEQATFDHVLHCLNGFIHEIRVLKKSSRIGAAASHRTRKNGLLCSVSDRASDGTPFSIRVTARE